MTKTRVLVAALAALVVAGAGAAFAATRLDSPSARSQAIIKDAAGQLNIAPSKLSDALKQAIENQIDAEVKAGTITQAQGDALKKQVEAGNVPLVGGFGLGLGRGPAGPFGRGVFALGRNADAIASYLGITTDELRTELQSGKTLAQIATAHGKTAAGLVDALYAEAKTKLDAAVKAGRLTSDQEQKALDGLKTMLTNMVDGTPPTLTPGIGPTFKFGFGLGRGAGPLAFGRQSAAIASYLGITATELRTELQSGKTLAQIATAHGKTAAGLVDAMVAKTKETLDAAVKAGKLTAAQEQQILSNLKPMLTRLVDGTAPALRGGLGRGFRFGFRGPGGSQGAPPQQQSPPSTGSAPTAFPL
jgi:transposase-like protein